MKRYIKRIILKIKKKQKKINDYNGIIDLNKENIAIDIISETEEDFTIDMTQSMFSD
jgi:hypothetical protein